MTYTLSCVPILFVFLQWGNITLSTNNFWCDKIHYPNTIIISSFIQKLLFLTVNLKMPMVKKTLHTDQFWGPPRLSIGYCVPFLGVKRGWGMMLTTYPHLSYNEWYLLALSIWPLATATVHNSLLSLSVIPLQLLRLLPEWRVTVAIFLIQIVHF